METIYDELDNFEHIGADDKIREEVIKLRVTVKEQEDEINRLKELLLQANRSMSETLEKIQTNFNSLLKTARAEVERKNEMINTLNAEKDQLIFRQIGNRNSSLRGIFNRKNPKNSKDETNSEITKVTKRKIESPQSEENKKPKLESQSASSDQTNDNNVRIEVVELDNQCNLKEDMSANSKTTKSQVEYRAEVSSIRANTPNFSSDVESETALDLPIQTEDKSSSKILDTLVKKIEDEKLLSQLSSRNSSEEVDKFVSRNQNNKQITEKKITSGSKVESSSELGKKDLRYRIPFLKSKEHRVTRKEKGNEIDKRETKFRDTRQEEEESIREKEDFRNRKEIQYTDRRIDSRYNKKEEKYQDRKTDEDYRNYKRMHEEQIVFRKSSRESDEYCENRRIEKTDHRRFSRSKYRDEAKYRYRQSKSCYGYDRYDKSSRLRSPRARDKPSRNIRDQHSPFNRVGERFVSSSSKRRPSMDRRSRGYNREGSQNSSCERPLDRYHTENDIKIQGDIEDKRKDSIQIGTKVSSRAFSGEGGIDTVAERHPAYKLRKKEKNDITDPSEIQFQQAVSEQTKEIVDVDSQTPENLTHTMDNILNIETRICQSPDDAELAVNIAQPETYIKLFKDTGSLNVFDDPRLYSVKYFNEDDIERNKLMKLTDSNKLSDTGIKFRIKTTDICLKTVMYVEENQKPEIQKKTIISEELIKAIYMDVDAQFSDSSLESGELDDSLYFDNKCDQIKPVAGMKFSAISPEEPTEKIYNSANASPPQSPVEVDPSISHTKDTPKINLQGYKIPKIPNFIQTEKDNFENEEATEKDHKHKNMFQIGNKEEPMHLSNSGSDSNKYSKCNVKKNSPENYQLGSLLRNHLKKKSDAELSACPQYEQKETANILKTKPKNSEENLLKNLSEKESKEKLSDCPPYEPKEMVNLLKIKLKNSKDKEKEKCDNNLDHLNKTKDAEEIRLDDFTKKTSKETEIRLILDSKNEGLKNDTCQIDRSIESNLGIIGPGDNLFNIASETGIDTRNKLSNVESNSSLTPDSLDHKKTIDIVHDRPKQDKQLVDVLDHHENNVIGQIREDLLERNKRILNSEHNDTNSQEQIKQKETVTNTSSRKTYTKFDHISEKKSSSSFKSESSCKDEKNKNKRKTSTRSKTDKKLQNNSSTKSVNFDPSTVDEFGIENKRQTPEIINKVDMLQTSTDDQHGHRISQVSRKSVATSKLVSKSKKETINAKMADLFGENSLITTEDLIGPPMGSKIINTLEEDFHLLNTFKGCDDLTMPEGTKNDSSKTCFGNTIKEVDSSRNKTDNIVKYDDIITFPVVTSNLTNDELLSIDVNKTICTDEKTKLCKNMSPEHDINEVNDKTASPYLQFQETIIQIASTTISKDVSPSPNVVQLTDSKSAPNSLSFKEGDTKIFSPSNTKKEFLKIKVDNDRVRFTDITKNSENYEKEHCVENKLKKTANTSTALKSLPMLEIDIEEEVTFKEKSKEIPANLENVHSKSEDSGNNIKYTKERKQVCNPSNIKLNCNQTGPRTLTKNIESVTPTDSDGEPTNTVFVTSTPNPKVSPQPNHKGDFCIQSPIKECSTENHPQTDSITLPKEQCVQSNNVSQSSTLSHDTSQSCVTAPRFIIGRRRRVIVKP